MKFYLIERVHSAPSFQLLLLTNTKEWKTTNGDYDARGAKKKTPLPEDNGHSHPSRFYFPHAIEITHPSL